MKSRTPNSLMNTGEIKAIPFGLQKSIEIFK